MGVNVLLSADVTSIRRKGQYGLPPFATVLPVKCKFHHPYLTCRSSLSLFSELIDGVEV